MARNTILPALMSAALLGLLAVGNAPAIAEQVEAIEEITVVAPRIVRERTPTGLTVITVDLDARVNFADLDLRRSADVMLLERRVNEAATRICEELAREFPLGEPLSTAVCVRRAVDDAMAQVREAVEAAAAGG